MHNKKSEYIKNPFNHPSLLFENSAHMTRYYHVSTSQVATLISIPLH